jgi:hypothetical protein
VFFTPWHVRDDNQLLPGFDEKSEIESPKNAEYEQRWGVWSALLYTESPPVNPAGL